jgi:flagellar hook-basal body complex protein FliE
MIEKIASATASPIQSRVTPGQAPDGESFISVLSSVAAQAGQSLMRAERVSVDALRGHANAREMVDSIMHAEQALQTALALRDKTVAAIQEITRMAI